MLGAEVMVQQWHLYIFLLLQMTSKHQVSSKKKKNVSSPRGANCLLSQAATPRWSEKDTFVKKMCDHYQSVVLSSLLFDDIIIIKSSQHCIPRCRALTLHQK